MLYSEAKSYIDKEVVVAYSIDGVSVSNIRGVVAGVSIAGIVLRLPEGYMAMYHEKIRRIICQAITPDEFYKGIGFPE